MTSKYFVQLFVWCLSVMHFFEWQRIYAETKYENSAFCYSRNVFEGKLRQMHSKKNLANFCYNLNCCVCYFCLCCCVC